MRGWDARNIGRRDGSSIHESTPTVDFILDTDDYLIGIAILSDEALGLLDLAHNIRSSTVLAYFALTDKR
jgi:hypothetical protein